MSPGTRSQTSISITLECTTSGERAYHMPCVTLAHAWSMPAGSSDTNTIIAKPRFMPLAVDQACTARLKTVAPVVQRKPIGEPMPQNVLKDLPASGHLQPVQHVISVAIKRRAANAMPEVLETKFWHPVRRQDHFNKWIRFEQLGQYAGVLEQLDSAGSTADNALRRQIGVAPMQYAIEVEKEHLPGHSPSPVPARPALSDIAALRSRPRN